VRAARLIEKNSFGTGSGQWGSAINLDNQP